MMIMQVLIIIYGEKCITIPYQFNGDAPPLSKKLKSKELKQYSDNHIISVKWLKF